MKRQSLHTKNQRSQNRPLQLETLENRTLLTVGNVMAPAVNGVSVIPEQSAVIRQEKITDSLTPDQCQGACYLRDPGQTKLEIYNSFFREDGSAGELETIPNFDPSHLEPKVDQTTEANDWYRDPAAAWLTDGCRQPDDITSHPDQYRFSAELSDAVWSSNSMEDLVQTSRFKVNRRITELFSAGSGEDYPVIELPSIYNGF